MDHQEHSRPNIETNLRCWFLNRTQRKDSGEDGQIVKEEGNGGKRLRSGPSQILNNWSL